MDERSRLRVLRAQLDGGAAAGARAAPPPPPPPLTAAPAAAAPAHLPRFDVAVMEALLTDAPALRDEVYGIFAARPDLLPAEEEGLSKEAHRELVRESLKALLAAGYSPLTFFSRDYAKYFYLAELLALVDLSLCVKMGVQYSLWGGAFAVGIWSRFFPVININIMNPK
jgi:acyl-CoA oxidase